MDTSNMLQYYREHSAFTDPGTVAALYDALPSDVAGLVQIVQGLLIPPYSTLLRDVYHVDPNDIDNDPFGPFGPRRMEELVERIQTRHAAPLTIARLPVLRIGVVCRNYAVLLTSMLRYGGVSARARVGFGGYFGEDYAVDHRIAEYWDEARGRWVRVDAMIDPIQRAGRNVTFDALDIGPSDPFWPAGAVWRRCRAGELDPRDFGDSDVDRGMPPIRYALLHDFAYLNKCEVLGCDDWGELNGKPEAELSTADLALLDRIAALTTQPDTPLTELRALFAETEYGQAVREQVALLGLGGCEQADS